MGRKHQSERLDILIADDDPLTRLALRQLFEGEGYRCAEAETGDEALQIAQLSAPRLALLDVMMPEPDGFGVARRLHTDPRTRDVRVVFLTALRDSHTIHAAQRAGCEMLLTKPVDFDGLLDALSVALYCPGSDEEKAERDPD